MCFEELEENVSSCKSQFWIGSAKKWSKFSWNRFICSHCGKPNHETKQCWLKPQSTTYRSDLAKGHCQTNVEATSGLAESNTSSSSNTRAPTGANGFFTKSICRVSAEKKCKGCVWCSHRYDAKHGTVCKWCEGPWFSASQLVVNADNVKGQQGIFASIPCRPWRCDRRTLEHSKKWCWGPTSGSSQWDTNSHNVLWPAWGKTTLLEGWCG